MHIYIYMKYYNFLILTEKKEKKKLIDKRESEN